MTLIIIIAVSGGITWYTARYLGALVFLAAVAVIVVPLTFLVMFINDVTGLSTFLPAAGEAIAGVSSTTQIPGECPVYTEQTWWSVLLGLVLIIPIAVGGVVAVFASPIGIIVTVVGTLKAIGEGLFRGNNRAWLLRLGLMIFAVGMAGIVLFGLAGRVAVYSATNVGCASIFGKDAVTASRNSYNVQPTDKGRRTIVSGSVTNRTDKPRSYAVWVEYWLDRNGGVQYAPAKDPQGQPYFVEELIGNGRKIYPGVSVHWEAELAVPYKKGLVRSVHYTRP